MNDTENRSGFKNLQGRTVSPILATASTVDNKMLRPGWLLWLSEFGDGEDVSDVTVDAPAVVGTTMAVLDLLEGCIMGLVEPAASGSLRRRIPFSRVGVG